MDPKKEMQPRGVERVVPGVEVPKPAEAQLEVESWMQKIEKKFARVPNKTATPVDDQVVVQSPSSNQPPVVLPVTAAQLAVGKKAKVEEGIAWLVTWMIRQWKQLTNLGRRVRLQDLPEVKE